MKRFLIIFAVLVALVWTVPAFAEIQDYWADVYKWTGGYNADGSPTVVKRTSGISYRVLATGADTKETLYAYNDNTYTSKANRVRSSVFATDKRIAFRCDPTDSTYDRYVDLEVVDEVGGFTAVVKNFDKYTHAVIIDERPNVMHHGIVFIDMSTVVSGSSNVTAGYSESGPQLSKHTFINAMVPEWMVTNSIGAYSVGVSGASSAFSYGTTVLGYRSTLANGGNMVVANYASNNVYFTTAATSIYTTVSHASGVSYYGNIHYWFTVTR